jgi:hypothetical protein
VASLAVEITGADVLAAVDPALRLIDATHGGPSILLAELERVLAGVLNRPSHTDAVTTVGALVIALAWVANNAVEAAESWGGDRRAILDAISGLAEDLETTKGAQ